MTTKNEDARADTEPGFNYLRDPLFPGPSTISFLGADLKAKLTHWHIASHAQPSDPLLPFFVLNELIPGTDRHQDKAVSCFRNILIECDEGALEWQYLAIKGSGLPYSLCTYSGSKSLHFIVSLENPMPDAESYAELVQTIYVILQAKGITIDTTCRNPSRLTRTPRAIRPETGEEQAVWEARARVTDFELGAWIDSNADILAAYEAGLAEEEEAHELARQALIEEQGEDFRGRLTLRTRDFMNFYKAPSGRHNELYIAAADFKNNNYLMEEAIDKLQDAVIALNIRESEARRTIKNAFKNVPLAPRK